MVGGGGIGGEGGVGEDGRWDKVGVDMRMVEGGGDGRLFDDTRNKEHNPGGYELSRVTYPRLFWFCASSPSDQRCRPRYHEVNHTITTRHQNQFQGEVLRNCHQNFHREQERESCQSRRAYYGQHPG